MKIRKKKEINLFNENENNNNSNNNDNIQSIYDKFMEIKNANIKSNSNSNNNNDSISISNSIKGNWSDSSSRVKMGIRKKY